MVVLKAIDQLQILTSKGLNPERESRNDDEKWLSSR